MASDHEEGGKKLIFRPWYVHPKSGKRVYPKSGGVFPFWVDDTEPH